MAAPPRRAGRERGRHRLSMASEESIIEIKSVSKHFGGVRAVDDITFNIRRGEFFSLLGPSGCGKTTLLRMLAGFEAPTKGEIYIDGQPMSAVPPHHRPTNMVFQSYAIFPHLTVAQNIEGRNTGDKLVFGVSISFPIHVTR